MVYPSASDAPSRYFPETGCTVAGVFLAFFTHYGVELCGYPLTDRVVENGVPTQYFQRLALEEAPLGQIRVKALGSEVLSLRDGRGAASTSTAAPTSRLLTLPPFEMAHDTAQLPHHASLHYATRALHDIRHLIVHHSGVPVTVSPEVIAGYHVTDLNWPGIGYHFVIDGEGQIHQTNALTTVSYHARQYNASSVGIVLLGDFSVGVPSTAQLEATATLCAWLSQELGLSREAIKGHRELVAVTCPGDQWLQGAAWKGDLVRRVDRLINGEPAGVEEPVAVMAEAGPMVVAEASPASATDATDNVAVEASVPAEISAPQMTSTDEAPPSPIWNELQAESHDAATPASEPTEPREPVSPLPPTEGDKGDNA